MPVRSIEQSTKQILEYFRFAASQAQSPSNIKCLSTALVQSSGSGKTRLVFELPRLLCGVKVAYLCLRPAMSTGAGSHFVFVRQCPNLH
jgi:hypothetical protein